MTDFDAEQMARDWFAWLGGGHQPTSCEVRELAALLTRVRDEAVEEAAKAVHGLEKWPHSAADAIRAIRALKTPLSHLLEEE